MHAVVTTVTVNDPDAAIRLRDDVVPQVQLIPGLVAGYWTQKDQDNKGMSMVIFESEDVAKTASEKVPEMVPDGVTLENVEVREVIAHT